MKWYTAVGVKTECPDDVFRIRTGKQEKDLLGVECYIWNTLLWSFVEEGQIYGRMTRLLNLAFPEDPVKAKVDLEEFRACFERLLIRELVISQEAESLKEAARELFKTASVTCVRRTFGERFLAFCESAAFGSPIKSALQVFKKNPLEASYKHLLKTIQDNGEMGLPLKEAEEGTLKAVIELYQNKLLFIQSVKEGALA